MPRRALALAAAVLALAGCARGETTVAPVAADELSAEIADRLTDELGFPPEVVCEDELPADVGASATCTIPAGDNVTEPLLVVATVSSVDESAGIVTFGLEVTAADETASPTETAAPTESATATETAAP